MAADLHHELAGDGPVVVLLHPGIADSRIWDPQWTRYADRFRVLRLDLPGFGHSPLAALPVAYARARRVRPLDFERARRPMVIAWP